ncbi:MAG: hypothetical protein ACFB10_21080 [Salibacteraceae bacterium]
MLRNLTQHPAAKAAMVFMALNLVADLWLPSAAWALSGGPSQPEVQSFEPVGTTQMVDPFSGDFTYNIPLVDVGGYPLNISYHSGINMDQEASWVGLGWNLNPGVINRNMRSVPDDFSGDKVKREFNVKDDETWGGGINASFEIVSVEGNKVGFDLGVGLGLNFNNYRGWGFDFSLDPSLAAGQGTKLSGLSGSLGINASSENGMTITPSAGYSFQTGKKKNNIWGAKTGLPFNTRQGVQALSINASYSRATEYYNMKKNPETGKRDKMKDDKGKQMTSSAGLANGGGSISFNSPSYSPKVGFPMVNNSFTFNAGAGSEAWGAFASGRLNGYHNLQTLFTKSVNSPAYGYYYAENGHVDDYAMMDFSRENDASFNAATLFLPVTSASYDVYSVSGQGVGGVYRPYRGNVGYMFDSKQTNRSSGQDEIGADVGFGAIFKVGANFETVNSNSESGRWVQNNPMAAAMTYAPNQNGLNFEHVYFKKAGELTVDTDPDFFANKLGGFDAIRMKLKNQGVNAVGTKEFDRYESRHKKSSAAMPAVGTALARNKRERRNEVIETLNSWEASQVGYIRKIQDYGSNYTLNADGTYQPVAEITRHTTYPMHHISEIAALRSDGSRYVYGIPAYNHKQVEASFAVNGNGVDHNKDLVNYSSTENSLNNKSGLDNYYDKTTMPAFAHSYLLTAVLADDYKDLTEDGPTPDDFGGYTKLNYRRAHSNYKWRTPIGETNREANYNVGQQSLKGAIGDDNANYVYGEKDIWYVHSIEPKTHLAEFYISARHDAKGVQGEDGMVNNSMSSYKLDKIELYTRADKIANGGNATPIKTVHFQYDYELCPGTVNSVYHSTENPTRGKLTLKKVYFTYQNSNQGESRSYQFNYGQRWSSTNTLAQVVNPSYHNKAYDRWGNYQAFIGGQTGSVNDPLSNAEFPYVDQTETTAGSGLYNADVAACAWNLSKIEMPSGADVYIHYEADDYAFVQDRRAMQMVVVEGVGANANATLQTKLWDDQASGKPAYQYLKFKLPNASDYASLSPAQRDLLFRQQYLTKANGQPMDHLFFKFMVDLIKQSGGDYEFVPGYAGIEYDACKVYTTGPDYYGAVKIKTVSIQDDGSSDPVSPISQAAWNYVALHQPHLAFDKPTPNAQSFDQVIKAIATAFSSFEELFKGQNSIQRRRQQGYSFIPEKSMIRLYHPKGAKKGGGSRVKRILLSDGMSKMDPAYTYGDAYRGQEYNYSITANGITYSSGVASYEPAMGGDENPFKLPLYNNEKMFLKPDQRYMVETPIGESLFPSASVGYSRVEVTGIYSETAERLPTGKTVKTFYTAKDFPTKVRQTPVEAIRKRPNPILNFLKLKGQDHMTASQGFVVELNDMHGKPKGEAVWGDGYRVSEMTYHYRQSGDKTLDNTMKAVFPDGTVGQALVGVDFDVVADFRQEQSSTSSGGLNVNTDGIPVGWLPIPIPIVLPKYTSDETSFRSATITKVINRHGLLERSVVDHQGGRVTTRDLAVDAETGETLLKEITNQYFDNNNDPAAAPTPALKDRVYEFTYPAHWAYDRMGPAYQNVGATFDAGVVSGNLGNYFTEGDILLHGLSYNKEAVVLMDGSNSYGVYDLTSGNPVTLGGLVKVIRSGHKNQSNVPIGTVTTYGDPTAGGSLSFGSVEVVNAGSVEFNDDWKAFCNCGLTQAESEARYQYMVDGTYRSYKSWAYLTGRKQSLTANNNGATYAKLLDLRNDGVFNNFSPFWIYSGNAWVPNYSGWTSTEELTIISTDGKELESKDALNLHNAAQYGYSRLTPTAMGANAEYREIGYDGFEDYDFTECVDDHFSFRAYANDLTESRSHTGRRSLRVGAGQVKTLQKKITN